MFCFAGPLLRAKSTVSRVNFIGRQQTLANGWVLVWSCKIVCNFFFKCIVTRVIHIQKQDQDKSAQTSPNKTIFWPVQLDRMLKVYARHCRLWLDNAITTMSRPKRRQSVILNDDDSDSQSLIFSEILTFQASCFAWKQSIETGYTIVRGSSEMGRVFGRERNSGAQQM